MTAARRGPYAPGAEARERILACARTEFGRRGYRATSLARIAEAADMTQQGVLYHFGSKAGLLRAVLGERDEQGLVAWPSDHALVGTEVLDEWDATVERNMSHQDLVRLSHTLAAEAADPDHPAHGVLVHHFELGRAMTVGALRAGVSSGQLRQGVDCEAVAHQIIAMSEGLETQWLVDPGGVDVVACFHDFTRELRQRIVDPRAPGQTDSGESDG